MLNLFSILVCCAQALSTLKVENNTSGVSNVFFKINEGSSSEQTIMVYYLSNMNSDGELSVTFETEVTNFKKPSSESANPRICLALRDKGRSHTWDIVQMSMRKFETGVWSSKDGMTSDPQNWCGLPWSQDAEEINDWIVE